MGVICGLFSRFYTVSKSVVSGGVEGNVHHANIMDT